MKGCLKFGQGLRRNALATLNAVIRKLDPRIHHLRERMDCRVKSDARFALSPGNDDSTR
jgi:hypothetical protein